MYLLKKYKLLEISKRVKQLEEMLVRIIVGTLLLHLETLDSDVCLAFLEAGDVPFEVCFVFKLEFVLTEKVRSNLIRALEVAEFLNTSLGPDLW